MDVGDSVRMGGGVESGFRSGLNGEEDGDGKGRSLIIGGNVKARGVGEMIATVGHSGESVATSRSARGDRRGSSRDRG